MKLINWNIQFNYYKQQQVGKYINIILAEDDGKKCCDRIE